MKQSWLLRFRKSPPHTQTNIICTALIMIATIAYAFIAGFQLIAMDGTLAEMKRSGEQSTQQMWSAIGNINWEARSMDWSQKVNQQSMEASKQQAQDSIRAAIEASRLDQRAWVGMNIVVTGPLEFRPDEVFLPVKIQLHNFGRSPAQFVKPFIRLVPEPTTQHLENYCDFLDRPPASKETNGWTLFPTDGKEITDEPGFAPRKEIDESMKLTKANPPRGISGKVSLLLAACADYTLAFDKIKHHQTTQIYTVIWFDQSRNGIGTGAFNPYGAYSPIAIRLNTGSTSN